ncbi:hypothetical protein TRIATDRAFT_275621 [Trichoderma atroviride IMI 206040]|uniref:Uncharacterized protein n=1 Tax=Hypocrea atroviridis (strain ATCC 20476 / IMI 206040) TaxID=452589 RepID=G9NY21_HYPAI|nr:uncharacterized protein TRIATDRAFT_275621 [Trichoderma atroviride IMI 206040]EHK44349.1 hypothetical protein TRIATDRAFT_275621 [Trichoderma atroviride IMI 206040]
MDASSSTSKAHEALPGRFPSISTSPSEALSASSPSSNGVNQEPHMRWPPPTFLAGQGFNMPSQQRASNPLFAFARLQEKYKQHFETRYGSQTNPFSSGFSSPFPSSKLPEVNNQHSSFSARLDQEQRTTASLYVLRHVQQTLQQRYQEAQTQLARTEKLIEQTAWDLFFQSPLDFMCHEMDIVTGAATINALTAGRSILPQAQSFPDSEAWMKKLDDLRDLQDEECAVTKRMERTMRQMKRTDEMMVVGNLKQQEFSLHKSSPFPFGGQYGMTFPLSGRFPRVQTVACSPDVMGISTAGPSKSTASAAASMFSNWPQPTPAPDESQDEAGSNNAADSSSTGSSSHFEARCGPDCPGRHGQ